MLSIHRWQSFLLTALAVILFAGGTAYLTKGIHLSWTADNDSDMRMLWDQYSLFEQGIYPHRGVAEAAGKTGVRGNSIYPPYAYPLLAGCFWPPSFAAARVLYQILSVAALGLLMWYGARRPGFTGRPAAGLGAAIPLAFAGNCSAVALGQFTIIAIGFLLLQMLLLQRDRSGLAGLCWACAMIKPQIALPFAVLFLIKPHWRGMIAGGATLLALTAFALWWTQVDPRNFWTQGVVGHRLRFVETTGYGAGLWIGALNVNPQRATLLGLGLVAGFGLALLFARVRGRFTLETAAAVAAVLAITLFYHRHYDSLLFVFLLLPLVALALQEKSYLVYATSALLALTVYAPPSMLNHFSQISSATDWLIFVTPIAACAVLLITPRIGNSNSRSDSALLQTGS
jgi:hypothetical protein